MKKKQFISVFLLLCIICVFFETAFAIETAEAATTSITIIYDGEQVPLDVQPIISGGRTMVPFRAIFEKLGYTVDYDSNTKTVSASNEKTGISLTVGSTEIHCGNTIVQSDVAPFIQSDRILVPVRIIAELSGCDVLWDANTQTVLIYHKQVGDYSPVTFTYMPMACDGKYLYTNLWNKDGIEVVSQISLNDYSVKFLPLKWLNDYMLYDGKLYGRYGIKANLSYGVYDPISGVVQDLSGCAVSSCYVYKGQLYYTDMLGPYKATLQRMDLDGTNRIELFTGNDKYPIGTYAIYNGLFFSGCVHSLFVMPLDTLEPLDILSLANLNENEVVVCDTAICGDYFYAALEKYCYEEDVSEPIGILQYNYKTGENKLLYLDYIVHELIVTDNSIYTWALRDGTNHSYDLYRSTLDGSYPVLLEENISENALMFGNYIYLSDLAGTEPTQNYIINFVRIATDGTKRKVLYSIY